MTDRYVDYVRLDQIVPARRNAKRHHADGIRTSLGRFGFGELPLIDERTGRLVAGHGRHDQLVALRDTGQPAPDGVRVDTDGHWHMPVIRGWSSHTDTDADAYSVASNRLTELGGWTDHDLALILADLADDDLLTVAGYQQDDLDVLLRTTSALAEQASAFLDDVLHRPAASRPAGPPEHDNEPSEPDTEDGQLGVDYVPVSWLVSVDDRSIIRTALTVAQKQFDCDTAAGALAALARHYLGGDL